MPFNESSFNKTSLQRICYVQVSFNSFSGSLISMTDFPSRFPNLRLLDFRKIKQKDRTAAVEFFKSKKGKEVLKEINKKAKLHVSSGQQDVASKGSFCLSIKLKTRF